MDNKPAKNKPLRAVSRLARRWWLFTHVVVSVGWLGAGATNVVLAMTAGYTGRADLRRICYYMIDQVDVFVVIPCAFAALATGVVLGVVTPWGLTRYWWVLTKLVLTIAVILYSTFGIGVWVEQSIQQTAVGTARSTVDGVLAYGAGVNIVAFLFMTWASIAKPWGRIGGPASQAGRMTRAPRIAGTD